MNEIIKKLNVMQVNNLKQYDNLLTKDNVGFRAYLLNDVEIYPEKCLYRLVQNPDTLAYEFAYAEDKTAKDLGSTSTNAYWYAGYYKYAKTLYNALDTIISALTTETDCTIIIGLEKEQTYNGVAFPSGMSKAVITPSTAIADINWTTLDSTFVWETEHANADYLTTPIVDDLKDVEKVAANVNKLVYLNKSEINEKGWYEIKETSTNKFEWVRVDDSNGEPIVQVDENKLGLADNVVGTVLRHGNDVKFHFHYKALGTPINEIAATMPKPFAGSIPEFVAATTTLDESLAVIATIDADGKFAFKDGAEVGDFTIDGAYYSSDWEPAEGWTPIDPAITEEYTGHILTTDVEGKVFHFGNFISFNFKYDETDPITEIATNMPFPIIDQNPEFVAVTNVGGEEVPTVVKLLQNGTLEFVDADGFNSFTVSGMYLSSNYEDWMEFDISMEKGIKQLTVMPEPIEAKEYQQIHYIGETNDDYTNNTIYICTRVPADNPADPDTFEWKEVTVSGDFIEQLENLDDSVYELEEENVGKRAYLCKSKSYSKGWYIVNDDLTLKEVKESDAKVILDGWDGQPRAGVVTYITPEIVSAWGAMTYSDLEDSVFCRVDTTTDKVVGGISGFATATMTDKNGATVQEGDFVSIVVDKADDSSPLGNALVKGDIEEYCEFVKETCTRTHSTRFALLPFGYTKDVAEIETLKAEQIGKLILLPDNLKRDKTFYDITKEVIPAVNYNNIYLIKWYGEALVPETDYEFVSVDNTYKKYVVYVFENKLTLTLLTAIHNKIKEYADGDDYNAVIAGGVTTSFEYLGLNIPAGMFLGKLDSTSSTDPVLTSLDQDTFKNFVTSYRVTNSLINTDYSDITTPLYQKLDKLTLGIPVSYAFVQDEIPTKTNIYWKKVQEGGGASESEVEIVLGTNWVKDGSIYQADNHVYIDATFTYSGTTENYDGIIISEGLPQPINPRIVEGITSPTMFPAMLPLQVTTGGKLVVYGTDKIPVGLIKVMYDYHLE